MCDPLFTTEFYMFTSGMSACHSPFGGSVHVGTSAASAGLHFTALNAFSSDSYGLRPLKGNDIWDSSIISPSPCPWNAENNQTVTDPSLALDLGNSHAYIDAFTPFPYNYTHASSCQGLPLDLPGCKQIEGLDGQLEPRSNAKYFKQPGVDGLSLLPDKIDHKRLEEVKRERFLQSNRTAASKCRKKKKEHIMLLESQFKEQSGKREELASAISQLHADISVLKDEVLKHSQCGDRYINLYLGRIMKIYNDATSGMADVADTPDSQTAQTGQAALLLGSDGLP